MKKLPEPWNQYLRAFVKAHKETAHLDNWGMSVHMANALETYPRRVAWMMQHLVRMGYAKKTGRGRYTPTVEALSYGKRK